MAKIKEKEKKITADSGYRFPLTRTNFLIIALGVLVIVLGYIFMAIPDDPDAFMTRTLAPVMLVFAYLIIIPVGLFYREKKEQQ